jgi:predicted phage tail component-like protein
MIWGFTYNGTHSSNLGVRVKSIRGRGFLSEVESRLMETATMNGSHYFGYRFKSRPITVEISLYAASLEAFRSKFRQLADWLNPRGGPKEMTFDDEQDKKYGSVITGLADPDEVYDKRTFHLTFICPDPLLYSRTESISSFSGDIVTIDNQGNEPSFPKFIVTFSDSADFLRVEKNAEEYVNINRSFAASDEVIIDHATGKITLNGTENILNTMDLDSDFFSLDPGSNTFYIAPSSVLNSYVSYVERWNA